MSETRKILVSMTCPSCGGQVQCEEGEQLVLCKFCNSVFSLGSDKGSGRVMYNIAVDREKALAKVRAWMGDGPKAPDLPSTAIISEAYPLYLPFWRLMGRGKACVCGVEIQRGGKDEPDREIPRESLINREYIYSDIACDPGDLGISAIRIPESAEAVSFDDEAIVTFGVTESRDDAYATGVNAIKSEAVQDGTQGIDRVSFSKSFFFPKGFTLVYYPFWIIRYKYEDRDYFATVDGITARVLSGRAPGNAGSQSTAAGLGGALSGGAIGLGLGAMVMLGMSELGIGIGIGGLVAGIAILFFAYNRFRYGDEIIEGAVKGEGVQVGRKERNVQTVHDKTYDMFN